ncbi:MAG TPA: sensor histidine kinase, partial [Sporichthya sp.]|nr:sensor histidine kinase [Sporichthya sp.]
GANVEIRITDAGTGPSSQLREHLFQRFATGASRGTGLGLFIVRELARAHGGDASYEPPVAGRPSGTFVISLPRAVAAERSDATRAPAAANSPSA